MQLSALQCPVSSSTTWVWNQQNYSSHPLLTWRPVLCSNLLHAQPKNPGSNQQISQVPPTSGRLYFSFSKCQRIETSNQAWGRLMVWSCKWLQPTYEHAAIEGESPLKNWFSFCCGEAVLQSHHQSASSRGYLSTGEGTTPGRDILLLACQVRLLYLDWETTALVFASNLSCPLPLHSICNVGYRYLFVCQGGFVKLKLMNIQIP